jgi:hypothetical protein
MKALLASLAALAIVATPAIAAQKTSTKPAPTKTIAKQAKAEGESTATEAKEHHAAARHHHAAKCSCSHYAKAKSHKMAGHKMASHKAAAKKTATSTKKTG